MNEESKKVRVGLFLHGPGGAKELKPGLYLGGSEPARNISGFAVGLVIVAFGVILLLDQEGVFPASRVLRLWPMLLIVPGLIRLFGGKDARERWWGAALVLIGAIWQLSALGYQRFRFTHIWPLWIILWGLWILYTVLRKQAEPAGPPALPDPDFNQVYMFSGGELQVTSKKFRSGRLVAIFGGFKLDMTDADIEGSEAVLEINAIFGGGEVRVPRGWRVVSQGQAIFGGNHHQLRPPLTEPANPKKLIVTGAWIFGGSKITN
jgi:hypothetical protein